MPRSILEVAGYVGVANYAIGRADGKLVVQEYIKTLAYKLNTNGFNSTSKDASNLQSAINSQSAVKEAIKELVKAQFGGAEVDNPTNTGINATTAGAENKLTVKLEAATGGGSGIAAGTSKEVAVDGLTGNNGVTVTIKIKDGAIGSLEKQGGGDNTENAKKLADKIKEAVDMAKGSGANTLSAGRAASQDFNAFTYIAAHDMLAMFCRFFYGKLAVGYNST